MSQLPGVLRVHPNGVNGKARVYVADAKAFQEKLAAEALQKTEKLRLRKMERVKANAG